MVIFLSLFWRHPKNYNKIQCLIGIFLKRPKGRANKSKERAKGGQFGSYADVILMSFDICSYGLYIY